MTEQEFKKLIKQDRYQVFLISCPAYFPINFAIHPWFVVNKKGKLTRWEVGHDKEDTPNYFGYIRYDGLPLFKGLPIISYSLPFSWGAKHIKLLGSIEGDENSIAHKMIAVIENSVHSYPYRDTYRLSGPNSNTYIQWVLDQMPEWKMNLSWKAIGKNFGRNKKIQNGIVHGRFQPPHNGHIRYMLSALERCEHLTIGISTPKICTEEEAKQTGYPCTAALNPFTHEERADMIRLSLEEAGVGSDRYTVIPFPSDYKDIKTLLPKDGVFLMSITSAGDRKKITYLQEEGFKVETIMTHDESAVRDRSGAVRTNAKEGVDWEHMVPKAIAQYLKKHGLVGKLAGTDSVLE